LFLDSFLLF